MDASAHAAYVTNNGDGTVSVLDTQTNTVTATVTVRWKPFGLAVDPATGNVFVVNGMDRTVSVLTAQ
ncbi:MAG: hypothetical protein ACYCTH_08305 [Cellulomonas sp.]